MEDENNKQEFQESMIPALGGPNTGGTRLFWDTETELRGEIIEDGSQWQIVSSSLHPTTERSTKKKTFKKNIFLYFFIVYFFRIRN